MALGSHQTLVNFNSDSETLQLQREGASQDSSGGKILKRNCGVFVSMDFVGARFQCKTQNV